MIMMMMMITLINNDGDDNLGKQSNGFVFGNTILNIPAASASASSASTVAPTVVICSIINRSIAASASTY